MPPRCQNRKSGAALVALLRLNIFSMRNIQKIHAPIGKNFSEKHCHFSGFRIYWEVWIIPPLRRKQVSSPPVQPHRRQAGGEGKIAFPAFFLLFFYSAGIRIFSVGIAPYFRSPGAAIVPVPALSALLPNRLLHFSGFFDRPDIPRFRLCHRHGSRLFPGAAIISAPASFRCRSYAGIFLFSGIDSSPAPESFFLCRCSVFGFQRGLLFYPFGFCAVVFFGLHPPVLSSYCPIF